ncbi:hypothetical protein [Streptomyces sp. NBRC 109706]|uniref:hypothetical protein n=1 Tax=Streptomyces sp. NBRC 109706 TaxID=1550035 RepID=UPI00131C6BD9|nr:hypothetical protein [Streptomyces sp. NBRC 109706]
MDDYETPDALEALLDDLRLPAGVHAAVLSDTSAYDNSLVTRCVVWSDRPDRTCPMCTQPINQDLSEYCPVVLDGSAAPAPTVLDRDQEHGCGHWLAVYTDVVQGTGDEGEVTEADVLESAQGVAEELRDHKQRLHEAAMRRLHEELTDVLERLAAPLAPGETRREREESLVTGSEMYPGAFRNDGGQWVAWDYNPNLPGEIIEVTADADRRAG